MEDGFLMETMGTPNLMDPNSPLYLFMSSGGNGNSNNTPQQNNTSTTTTTTTTTTTSSNASNNNININNSVDSAQKQLELDHQHHQQQQQQQDHDDNNEEFEKQKLEQQFQQYQQQHLIDQQNKFNNNNHGNNSLSPPQQTNHQQLSPAQQQHSQLSPAQPLSPNHNNNNNNNNIINNSSNSVGGIDLLDFHYLTPPQPPPPPPVVPHFTTLQQPVTRGQPPVVFTTQLLQMQQRNLRPVSERGQEDKKKEALSFLSFYFRVVPGKKVPSVPRSTVLSLYTNKISMDKRYKQPNDMANLCGAVYTFIFQNLDDKSIRDYIASAENERSTSKNDVKKRKRRKNHDVSNGLLNNHDAFLTCIKYASLLPFIEFIHTSELSSKNYGQDFKATHPDWKFTHDELARWEGELRDYKSTNKRTVGGVDDIEFALSNSYNINAIGTNVPIGGGTFVSGVNNLAVSNNNNNNNNTTTTTTTTAIGGIRNSDGNVQFHDNGLDSNVNNNNNAFSNSVLNNNNNNNNTNNNNQQCNNNSTINFFKMNSIPVNVTETLESFIIYAFIPFYKPNALKITVNQMDIILEGVISLPETIQIPNGSEILVPNSFVNCKQMDIQEGHFSKVIRLSAPIASSTVGKRDGVVVIIARKEEKPSTVHQL